MREAIAHAEVGDEQKREDPTVNELERRVAELLGQEEAVFLPTATMANQIALRLLGEPGDELLADANSHVCSSRARRAGGPLRARCAGCPGDRGRLTPEQSARPSATASDLHVPATRVVVASRTRTTRGRPRLAARGARGRRRACAGARARRPPRRRAAHERRGRARRAGGRARRHVRHGDALPLEGPRAARSARSSRARRSGWRRRGASSTCSAARCARRGSSPRPASTRSTTTSTASRTTTRAPGGSPRARRRGAAGRPRRRSRRTSSSSTSAPLGLDDGGGDRAARRPGVGLSARSSPTSCAP